MAHEDYISAVNSVISICKDAQQGFDGAAKAVKNPAFKALFEEYSVQRGEFVKELQEAVRDLGGKPEDPTGVAGVLHSGWMALKGVLTGHSEHQILEETERGEDLSLKTYRDALSRNLSDQVRQIVQRQYQQIEQAHERIRALRDQTAHKS